MGTGDNSKIRSVSPRISTREKNKSGKGDGECGRVESRVGCS